MTNQPLHHEVHSVSRRGFAAMEPERQREIARRGGRAAQERGLAHRFSSDEAKAAGRKGGEAVSRDRSHMASIGRRGGQARSAHRETDVAIPVTFLREPAVE